MFMGFNHASCDSKRAPRAVSVDFKSRPPPVRNPEYAPGEGVNKILNFTVMD